MNFLNLQYFLVVAEELHITRAAERLYISQQALSRHIANLEQELQTTLFNRTPEFTLTPAGERLYFASKQLLEIKHQVEVEIQEINKNIRGKLNLGIGPTYGLSLLPSVLPAFHKKHPLIQINLTEDNPHRLQEELLRGEVDLCIDFRPSDQENLISIPLQEERIVYIVPNVYLRQLFGNSMEAVVEQLRHGMHMTHFSSFPAILLKRGDRLRAIFDSELHRDHIRPSSIIETGNLQTAYTLAANSLGITLYPESFLRKKHLQSLVPEQAVSCFPVKDLKPETLVVYYDSRKPPTQIMMDFIDVLKTDFRQPGSRFSSSFPL